MSFAVSHISFLFGGDIRVSLPRFAASTTDSDAVFSLCDQVFTLEQGRNIFSHFYDWNRLHGGGGIRDRRGGKRTRDEAMHMTSQHRSRRNGKRTLDALYDLARCYRLEPLPAEDVLLWFASS